MLIIINPFSYFNFESFSLNFLREIPTYKFFVYSSSMFLNNNAHFGAKLTHKEAPFYSPPHDYFKCSPILVNVAVME
jgi:hypothetical protein